jgi:glucose-6-phosphate isomerase
MFSERLGSGISKSEIENIKQELKSVKEKFLNTDLGYKKLPYNFDSISRDLETADKLAEGMDTIVVIGIGGSDLGTRALQRALNHQYYNSNRGVAKKLYFSGDTTDPEAISDLLDIINLETTLFFVVSKSGNTIEQGSTFVYFRELIKAKLGDEAVIKHFAFLTDPISGTLRELSSRDGYIAMHIPSDVGGRFSVLSTVGMVPAHLVGLNIEEFLRGARELDESIKGSESDMILEYVAAQYLYYKQNKKISVMMPYQYSLFEFAKWYQQLWAESLGKRVNAKGEVVYEGATPAAVLGPTDQHSQLQLYNEGPNDKLFTFIISEESRRNIQLPENYTGVEQYGFMKGRSFHEILKYEMETTAFALTKNERPNATITIPTLNEYYIGQLFYFFEVAVTYMGYLLDINPFDQPGVELSKNAMYGILGKSGYEKEMADFEEYNKK